MASGLSSPSIALVECARAVSRPWLRRLAVSVAGTAADRDPVLTAAIDSIATRLVGQLELLMAADVEQQRSTPLTIFGDATRSLTTILTELDFPAITRGRFETERFPDDIYGLMPATWSDIDEALCGPALEWGAWKAMTIIDRRRPDDGDQTVDAVR